MKKDLTKISDLNRRDFDEIMALAFEYKQRRELGERHHPLYPGSVVAMIFEKPSLRTKVAFEVATVALGMTPVFLSSSQILASGNNQSGRESIPDIGRNLERFADVILARVYKHEVITGLARSVSVPVINLLCDRHHPTQALADAMAIRWHFGGRADLSVAFIGDGNNVATSLMEICALAGINFRIASPAGFEIPEHDRKFALKTAAANRSTLEFVEDPCTAVRNVDVIYTDTFISMGQEEQSAQRLEVFNNYQVSRELLALASPGVRFMHCLPAHRGEEVTDEVMDGAASIVFDQAECRLHVAKALLNRFLRAV